ncbi:hypothetical protein K449DRAFT_116609 [Hypoxylon sp. EC38]|nr:hypothetical protein K449DRAFT_116609 [Hypoxylon sp. EC38]
MVPAEKKKGDITDKEAQVLAMAWYCFKTPPEVDLDKLAKLTGYVNPRSVSNLLAGVKKKIAAAVAATSGEDDGETPLALAKHAPKTTAKTTPRPLKRKAPAGDDSDEPVTPTPSKRTRGKKVALSKATVEDDDSDTDKKGIKDTLEKNGAGIKAEADEDIVD